MTTRHGATYEITLKGEAGASLGAAFSGFELHSSAGVTVVRARLPDQAALHGLLDRAGALGLEVLRLRQVIDVRPEQLPDAPPAPRPAVRIPHDEEP